MELSVASSNPAQVLFVRLNSVNSFGQKFVYLVLKLHNCQSSQKAVNTTWKSMVEGSNPTQDIILRLNFVNSFGQRFAVNTSLNVEVESSNPAQGIFLRFNFVNSFGQRVLLYGQTRNNRHTTRQWMQDSRGLTSKQLLIL